MKKLLHWGRRWAALALALALMTSLCAVAETDADLDLKINEDLGDEWWNILLLGSESRDFKAYYGLSDTMVILSVNMKDGRAKMTSIMRDTWVDIDGVGHQKINAANAKGGPELAMRTVNEYFGMNIQHYVLVGIEALADIIDEVGGVEIEISSQEMKKINEQLTYDADEFHMNHKEPLSHAGKVTLNGNQAVAYARIRKLDSDYVRTQRQRNVLLAIASKLQGESLATLVSVATKLMGYTRTNLTMNDITTLMGVGVSMDLSQVQQLRLPADGTFNSVTENEIWSIRADFPANQEILRQFIYEDNTDYIEQ